MSLHHREYLPSRFRPSCSSTMLLQMASPSPVPPLSLESLSVDLMEPCEDIVDLVRGYTSAAVDHADLDRCRVRRFVRCSSTVRAIELPAGENFTAFDNRLVTVWMIRSLSTVTRAAVWPTTISIPSRPRLAA